MESWSEPSNNVKIGIAVVVIKSLQNVMLMGVEFEITIHIQFPRGELVVIGG